MGFTTDAWAKKAKKPKPQAYFVRVDPSVHAGEVWKVKIDILDAQPGETFTYHWQSGFSSDNKWYHLEDNAVYSGTHTPEFGFKTKVGATKGFPVPFRCKIVGSKSGKFYSNEIMMPDVIPSESGGKARAYIVHIGSSVYAGEVWKVKLDILNAQPGETFTYHWQSGFPQDNTWYHLGDNAVYSGTRTPEFGFKTKVGATKGFPIPFRCKIVGSKSGKFYSTEIMMPDPIPDKDHPTSGKYKEDYPKYIGNGVIEVKWWPGEDNATQQKDLRYLVTWRKKPGNTWYESKIYENITSYKITDVDPDAKYEVLVIVSDKTGNRKFYPYKTVSTFSAPTAGKYVAGYPKAISPYGIKLQWESATDGTTVKPLKYQVQWMKASESYWSMGYRSEEKAGMTKYIIGGLMENTEYLMRVRVVNANGAEAFYRHAVVKTPSVTYFEQPKFKDKRISVVSKRDRAVTLEWKPAQAGWKPKSELRYKVFEKNVWELRWIFLGEVVGKTEYTVTGLVPDTYYRMFATVVNEEGRSTDQTNYAEFRTEKKRDEIRPTFDEGAQVTVDEVTETSITLSWPQGKDNETKDEKMRYTIMVNKRGYANPEGRTYTFTDLEPGSTHKYWVYALDERGNRSKPLFVTVTTKTPASPDLYPPSVSESGAFGATFKQPTLRSGGLKQVSVTPAENALKLSWPAAVDDVTPVPELFYEVFVKKSTEAVWPAKPLGTNKLSHTLTGLTPGTEYDVCVTVYDKTGKHTDYPWVLKAKTKPSVVIPHPASVDIAPGALELQVSASARLMATVLPENVADKSVMWSSNLPDIASVNAVTGEVTALAVGKAEITATANDKAGGTKKKTIEVNVYEGAMTQRLVTEVCIMPADLTLYEGEEMDYTEDVQPAEADDKELTWTSSDPTVATIAAGGHVKALKAGTTTITATADDGSGTYGQARIRVRPKAAAAEHKATGIVVDQKKCILKEKATATLTARVLPVTAADKGFRWSSSDPRVASVNSDGVVTAHLPGGTALIRATADDGGWTDYCVIKVEGTSVQLTPNVFTLEPGESLELQATTQPWDSPMTKSFSSNNLSVAEVDKDGVVKAKVVGDATITVTLSGGQKATCDITVKKGGTPPNANEPIADASGTRIWAADGRLHIAIDKPTDVEVIHFSGLLLKKFRASAGDTSVILPIGMYVVKAGDTVQKVRVD
ncbi:hypothetical protein BHU11_08965 [Tannerella sp. oral taxon 808]|nr:hypothetical protein BHU11_08965 [Tannerella sp. oral taxon 808]